jgi:hypothetical protein
MAAGEGDPASFSILIEAKWANGDLGIQAKGQSDNRGTFDNRPLRQDCPFAFLPGQKGKKTSQFVKKTICPGQFDNDMPCALHCLSSRVPQGNRATGEFDNAGC